MATAPLVSRYSCVAFICIVDGFQDAGTWTASFLSHKHISLRGTFDQNNEIIVAQHQEEEEEEWQGQVLSQTANDHGKIDGKKGGAQIRHGPSPQLAYAGGQQQEERREAIQDQCRYQQAQVCQYRSSQYYCCDASRRRLRCQAQLGIGGQSAEGTATGCTTVGGSIEEEEEEGSSEEDSQVHRDQEQCRNPSYSEASRE